MILGRCGLWVHIRFWVGAAGISRLLIQHEQVDLREEVLII